MYNEIKNLKYWVGDKNKNGPLYTGPQHLVNQMNGVYGIGVRRN